MQLTNALYRNSVLILGAFLIFAFYAFWPGYFHNPLSVLDYHVHLHSIIASAWVVLLVAQAYLIRTKRRSIHRQLGRVSYVLAPLVFLTTLSAFHNAMQGEGDTAYGQHMISLMVGEIVLFGLMYGLAMHNRAVPAIHARYMICTPLPMIGPVFNRILGSDFPNQMAFLPTIDGHMVPQYLTVPATFLIIGLLALWDWKSHNRKDVFPLILVLFVVFEGAPFVVYRWSITETLVQSFLNLPLS